MPTDIVVIEEIHMLRLECGSSSELEEGPVSPELEEGPAQNPVQKIRRVTRVSQNHLVHCHHLLSSKR